MPRWAPSDVRRRYLLLFCDPYRDVTIRILSPRRTHHEYSIGDGRTAADRRTPGGSKKGSTVDVAPEGRRSPPTAQRLPPAARRKPIHVFAPQGVTERTARGLDAGKAADPSYRAGDRGDGSLDVGSTDRPTAGCVMLRQLYYTPVG